MPLTDTEIERILDCGVKFNPEISTIFEVESDLISNQLNKISIPKEQNCNETYFISKRYCRLIRLDTDSDLFRLYPFDFLNTASGARALCDRILIAITPNGQIVVMPIEQKGGTIVGYDEQLRNGKLFSRFIVSALAAALGIEEGSLSVRYVPILLCNRKVSSPKGANVSSGFVKKEARFEPLRETILPALKAKCGDTIRLENLIDTFFREFPELA